jgi:subtilisin-like proprotein convertase family protein
MPLVFAVFLSDLGLVHIRAAAPLLNTYELKTSAGPKSYTVSLTELFVASTGLASDLTAINQATANGVAQYAASLAEPGVEAKIVIYPTVGPVDESTRRVVSKMLLVNVGIQDPLVLAQAHGLMWHSDVAGLEGFHLFRAPNSAAALIAAKSIGDQAGVVSAEPILEQMYQADFVPNDPLFPDQWHLLNTGQNGAMGGDVNITNVWDTYTGEGIIIAVMDTSTDYFHEDLKVLTNFALNTLNFATNGFDTNAHVGGRTNEFHGTAVSGVAAAIGNNGLGGSGAAMDASIIPIRILAGGPTALSDFQIAAGLLHSNSIVDVHNNSWGPGTGGRNISQLGILRSNAVVQGSLFGRGGRGTIYVWSAGNDGERGGNANYIGHLNMRETVAIGALNDLAERASYSNPGANLVISAPAGRDATRPQGTTTTDVTGMTGYSIDNYTAEFNGTSSAAPLVSGCVALLLEANPGLGWRDVQNLLIRTATMNDTNHTDWITNGAGYTFNHDFGPGMVNIGNAIQLATNNWTNLAVVTNYSLAQTNLVEPIPSFDTNGLVKTFVVDLPVDIRLEHVMLKVDITHRIRGDLEITMESPSGTRSVLSAVNADVNSDYDNFEFLSVRNWGELVNGTWTVRVADLRPGANGLVDALEMNWFGVLTNASSLTNPPSISPNSHPRSRTVTLGSTVFFNVVADGTPPLTYQWISNGVVVAANNSPIYSVTNVQQSNGGTYAVRIFNSFGNVQSRAAELTVNIPPEITTQPDGLFGTLGTPATFSVSASGNNPLSFQWRFNGTPISGANSPTLSISNINSGNLGLYDVIVQNPVSSIISRPAGLSAFSPLTPPSGGSFQFTINAPNGHVLRIDGSSDLINWTPISTNSVAGGSTTFTDSSAPSTNRYYRVVPIP